MKRSLSLLLLAVVSLGLFLGCEVGMGASPDLEAPEVTILTPEKLSNVHLTFELGGKCFDNTAVTQILVSNFVTGVTYGKAQINQSENTWTFPMQLTKADEGEITILVAAYDKAGNESTKSKKTITLLVDDTPPESEDWYIERGSGITIKLYEKSYLESLDKDASVNKDLCQNQSFTIRGKISDGMSIKESRIILKENGNVIASKTILSTYTPSATFNDSDIDLDTGIHYLNLVYECKDEHDNTTTGNAGYLIWYPESDIPKATQNSADANGNLTVLIQNSIPVDYYDDDQVEEVLIALKNPAALEGVTAEDLISNESKRNTIFRVDYTDNTDEHKAEFFSGKIEPAEGVRDDTFVIPNTYVTVAAQMKIVVCIKDSNGIWNAKIFTVTIKDSEQPNLYITDPAENSIPSIKSGSDSKFDVKGYVLDKRVHEGYVKIVYIPTTGPYAAFEARDAKARQILAELEVSGNSGSKTDYEDGITVFWQKPVTDNTFTDPTNSNWKKRTYSFEYDLLNSFGSNGNQPKYFGLLYTDYNGNEIFKSHTVDGDTLKPKIDIASPDDMHVVNYTNESLLLSFKGTKDTRLGMDDSSYRISILGLEDDYTYTPSNGLTKNGDNYQVTLNSTVLTALQAKVSQPTFEFYVKDKLGNDITDRRTVVLSVLPKAVSITTDNDGKYKATDVNNPSLFFKVNFDKEVKIVEDDAGNKPRLVLYYSESDKNTGTNKKYAQYYSGSGTKALTFKYDIPSNVTASKICCPDTGYIEIAGTTTIETASIGTGQANLVSVSGNNLKGKNISIDSVPPKFNTIKISTTGGTTYDSKVYVKADDEISVVLTASENLMVSGSPKLILKSDTADFSFDFQGPGDSDNQLVFVHKVTSSSANGTLKLNGTVYFSNTDKALISDEIGNKISTLTALTLTNDSKNVVIDTQKPSAPPTLKLNGAAITGGNKTQAQTLTFENYETGANVYFSLNGGSAWIPVTQTELENGIVLPSGSSSVCAKQIDIAGNESDSSTPVSLYIVTSFPTLSGLTITNANGYYKTDDEIEIKFSFEGNVILSTNNAYVSFTPYGGGSVRKAYFETTTGAKTITAKYKILANESFTGIKITGFTKGSLKDSYNLSPANNIINTFLNDGNGWRKDIIVDSIKPVLYLQDNDETDDDESPVPAVGGISANAGTSEDKFTITLKFSEPVFKESGYITLQRIGADKTTNKGNWAIPAIIESEDFIKIYNQLDDMADREILMQTEGGNGEGAEKLQATTARPFGPYMKYTHGIKDDGSPDQKTRYVLAPEYGLYGTTGTVADIRNVLAKTAYHQHKVDINSSQVSGDGTDTITITFNDRIEDGQHWVLLIEGTALRDNAQNYVDALTYEDASYDMWSKKVAEPVIRVDRYSHNIGASEPNPTFTDADKTKGWKLVAENALNPRNITQWSDNGTQYNNADANSATKLAPTGYAKVRIDCETPGAVITFGVHTGATNNGATSGTGNPPSTTTYDANGKISNISNVAKSDITAPSNSYTQGRWLVVGDGLYTSARKDYISAKATAPSSASAMEQSSTGYEGVFKTVVNYKGHGSQIQIQGGTFNGGMPSIPGFPLRDAVQGTSSQRYNQNSYRPATATTDNDHYWVTYDIISEYSILSVYSTTRWSEKYSYGQYGQISTLSNITHYN